jgi:hypothetical protein
MLWRSRKTKHTLIIYDFLIQIIAHLQFFRWPL